MNNYACMGRFARDPELKTTGSGTSVCTFTLAVPRPYKPKDGGQAADFLDFVAWEKTAEFISKYFKTGDMAGVTAYAQTRSYEDKKGSRHKVTEFVVSRIDFGGSKKADASDYDIIADEEDLPF